MEEDALTKTWFHKALLLFNEPASWPTWLVLIVLFLLEVPVVLSWWLVTASLQLSIAVGCATFIFTLLDGLLFWTLPRRGLSFGSWKAQTMVLAIPRALAAIVIAFVALLIGESLGLLLLIVIQLTAAASLLWGAVVEPFKLQLTSLSISSSKMPADGDPVRILHISDLHVERLTKREKKLLDLVDLAKADLILITGDYLNLSYIRDDTAQADVKYLLDQLSAPLGVYAVLGSPPVDERDVVPHLFDDLDVDLLVDQNHKVQLVRGQQLILMGLDCSHDLPLDKKRLMRLVEQNPDHGFSILLHHSPDLFDEAAGHGVDLYLCGHTHGGQVRLPWIGAILTSSVFGRRFQMGLYHENTTNMYVSKGVGLEGLGAPRVRFLCPPEITLITISGEAPAL
jgi:predicted MPP superfamily phosphohydrolase